MEEIKLPFETNTVDDYITSIELTGKDKSTFGEDCFGVHIHFKNGYGASVIKHRYSYGYKKGMYEIAVLDANGHLSYDTPVTDDVIGFIEAENIQNILKQIADLESEDNTCDDDII